MLTLGKSACGTSRLNRLVDHFGMTEYGYSPCFDMARIVLAGAGFFDGLRFGRRFGLYSFAPIVRVLVNRDRFWLSTDCFMADRAVNDLVVTSGGTTDSGNFIFSYCLSRSMPRRGDDDA